MSSAPLLEARGVSKEFVLADGLVRRMRGRPAETLKAVDDVSLTIERGETVGLVGESGCGKSTFGRLLLRLYEPTAGQIFHNGINILGHDARATRELRTKIQVVFQDPYSSLNPTMTVRQMIEEVLKVHKVCPPEARAGAGGRAAGDGGPLARDGRPQAAPVQRRPAAADRHRQGPGRGAGLHRGRRGGLRARRLGAGPGAEPDDAPAGGPRPDLPVHRPQPGRGAAYQPAGRGDVPRQDRGACSLRRAVQGAAAPLHPGAAPRRAQADTAPQGGHPGPGGRPAEPRQPPHRLPFPPALPPRDARLPRGLPHLEHRLARPQRGLPPLYPAHGGVR